MGTKQAKHGGYRPGSGRKPLHKEGRSMAVGITIPTVLVKRLDRWCRKHLKNRSEAVTEAVRQLISSKPKENLK